MRFRPERGFYEAPFDLTITEDAAGATIRYTLDGSDPRSSGAALAAPIRIDPARADGRLINGALAPAVVVRAIAFQGGNALDPSTHTYIFPEAVLHQPDTSGKGPYGSTAMDQTVVGDPEASRGMRDGLEALATLSLVLDPNDIFGPAGIYWGGGAGPPERPASLELIDPVAGKTFQINCGLQKAGDHNQPKQSLTVYFRSEYGAGLLHYPLFGPSTVARFDVLRLRTSGQDQWHADGNAEIARTAS